MFRHRLFLPALLAAAILTGCGSQSPSSSGASPSPAPSPSNNQQVVGVSGTQMTLNGNPWLSRGVVLQGFVRPLSALQVDPTESARLNARMNYGAAELAAIRAFHADTIRFQIGQPALDPNSPLYDPNYLNDVVNAIKTARQAGFVVMIMMQDEAISGETTSHPLPIAETQSDWDQFNTAFGSDRGVVFELYNEPNLLSSSADWQLWLNGGPVQVGSQTQSAIGMQALINHLRANGAQNVFVLDGLGVIGPDGTTRELTETLQGVPAVSDPLNRLVYAVHPYQHGFTVESQWDNEFGIPSRIIAAGRSSLRLWRLLQQGKQRRHSRLLLGWMEKQLGALRWKAIRNLNLIYAPQPAVSPPYPRRIPAVSLMAAQSAGRSKLACLHGWM